MVWSYILEYENDKNPYEEKRKAITPWKEIASEYINESESIISYAEEQGKKGIKPFDALHIACAALSGCNFFLTTDKKLLNTPQDDIRVINPIDFISEMEK